MSDITKYENLANAIVLQAVKDYRKALKYLNRNSKDREALANKREVERFFRSQWFTILTRADGEMLIRSLKAEADGE